MALGFKVYDDHGKMIATTSDAMYAAAVIASTGILDQVVKFAGRVVWHEGREEVLSGESYDRVATIMYGRIERHHEERMRRYQHHEGSLKE